MNFYIKQKVFSFRDRFFVYDENGIERFYVEGEIFSLGKKLHLFDTNGNRLADICQKVFSFLPRYCVTTSQGYSFEVMRHFSFFRPHYGVAPFGWDIRGNFFYHEYEAFCGEDSMIRVYKEWFTFGDAYKIEINDGVDVITALSVVLVIDACIDQQEDCNV
jgi:uncharacterized protein YxjI